MLDPSTSVQFVKGIGPRLAEVLAAKGIHTVDDLLHYLPFRYEDRVNPRGISELRPGEMATVIAEVRTSGIFPDPPHADFSDDRRPGQKPPEMYMVQRYLLTRPVQARANGSALRQSGGRPLRRELQLMQPQFEILGDSSEEDGAEQKAAAVAGSGRIVPIYESAGQGRLTPRWFRRVIHAVLENLTPELPDPFPAIVRNTVEPDCTSGSVVASALARSRRKLSGFASFTHARPYPADLRGTLLSRVGT